MTAVAEGGGTLIPPRGHILELPCQWVWVKNNFEEIPCGRGEGEQRGCGVVMDRNFGTSLGGNYYVCVQTLLITFAISLRNKTKLFYFLNHTRLHEDDHKVHSYLRLSAYSCLHCSPQLPSNYAIIIHYGIDRVDEGSCSGSSSADNKLTAFRMPVTRPRYNLIKNCVYSVMDAKLTAIIRHKAEILQSLLLVSCCRESCCWADDRVSHCISVSSQ